jgi:hypothetical protein
VMWRDRRGRPRPSSAGSVMLRAQPGARPPPRSPPICQSPRPAGASEHVVEEQVHLGTGVVACRRSHPRPAQ